GVRSERERASHNHSVTLHLTVHYRAAPDHDDITVDSFVLVHHYIAAKADDIAAPILPRRARGGVRLSGWRGDRGRRAGGGWRRTAADTQKRSTHRRIEIRQLE